MSSDFTRRSFLESVAIGSLMVTANSHLAFALAYRSEVNEWSKDMRLISEQLLKKEISPKRWQHRVSALNEELSITEPLLEEDEVWIGTSKTDQNAINRPKMLSETIALTKLTFQTALVLTKKTTHFQFYLYLSICYT